MAYSVTACGKYLAVSIKDSDTVEEVKRKYAGHTGTSAERLSIAFCGEELENSQPLSKYEIRSGDLYLVSLGRINKRSLVACTRQPSTNDEGRVDAITVSSTQKPKCPDVKFKTIRLSCSSHTCGQQAMDAYAGFILYAWRDTHGRVLDDWWLNGKHCKSAYMVIQGTSHDGKKNVDEDSRCRAVYWNVFGKEADVNMAIGEGFVYRNGKLEWNSFFNKRDDSDAYCNAVREISALGKKCVQSILMDWKKGMASETLGTNFSVQQLLTEPLEEQF